MSITIKFDYKKIYKKIESYQQNSNASLFDKHKR